MAAIRSLPPSPFAAVFPSRGRLTDLRGAPGFGSCAVSTRRSSVAAASLPRSTKQYSERTGPVEEKLIKNATEVAVSTIKTTSRRFKWTPRRTSFLIRYMVQKASDAKWKEEMFREDNLLNAAKAVSLRFQRECGVADVKRRLIGLRQKWLTREIWDPATRKVSMRDDDYQQYAMVHPMDSRLINRPIEFYDDLAFMFGDEKYPGNTQAEEVRNTHSVDIQMSEDPMDRKVKNEDIRYLVLKIGELIDALKDLKPRDFDDDLWKAVTACGYNDRMAITAFEYFLKNEVEGKIFLVRSPELRKEWLAKFFSRLL